MAFNWSNDPSDTAFDTTDFTPFPALTSDVYTLTPSPLADSFHDTFKAASNMMVIVPIVFGVVVVIIVAVVISCYFRSQRIKKADAEHAARARELQQQQSQQQRQHEDDVRAEQHTPALPHVLLVSPSAPTYNSSVVSSASGGLSMALAVPSAPTADLDEQQLAYEIALQQRELDRYKREPVRRGAASGSVPAAPIYQPPPMLQQHQHHNYCSPPNPYEVAASLPAHQPPSVPPPRSEETQPQPQSQPWDDPVFVASRIPMDALYVNALISRGGFGEVYRGTYRGQPVALKKLLPGTRRDLKQIAAFFAEIKLAATMEHERIVRYIGVSWDALSDVCVVTEFMEGGDLRSVLTRFDAVERRPQGFDKQKATIALHIAHALTYLHSLQSVVLHRDLKSKNILLDESQWSAKLTDFGVSRERSDTTITAAVGTILWMAPEVMAGERYDDKADAFSFGIVLSELDTHAMPYADVKARMAEEAGRSVPDTALLQRIMAGRVRVSFSSELRGDIRALAQSCVALDPAMRPSAAQLLYELHKIMNSL